MFWLQLLILCIFQASRLISITGKYFLFWFDLRPSTTTWRINTCITLTRKHRAAIQKQEYHWPTAWFHKNLIFMPCERQNIEFSAVFLIFYSYQERRKIFIKFSSCSDATLMITETFFLLLKPIFSYHHRIHIARALVLSHHISFGFHSS